MRRLSFAKINVGQILKRKNSVVRQRFEDYAERQYAAESVRFVEEVTAWKLDGCDPSAARELGTKYIFAGALYEINISGDARFLTVDALKGEISAAVFDRAVNEVCLMMQYGTWGNFVSKGYCDDAAEDVNSDGSFDSSFKTILTVHDEHLL